MARGIGLMGEAGPEAVLPLRRLPSGRLGVESGGSTGQARGGGGHSVSVNVVVNGGDQATADRFRRTATQAARDALLAAERAQAAVRLDHAHRRPRRMIGDPLLARRVTCF